MAPGTDRAAADAARVVDRADDGTPLYAPRGELLVEADGSAVQCHLCGRWFRLLGAAHLPHAHRLTAAEYRVLVGLRPRHPLSAPDLSDRRAALMRERIATDSRVSEAMASGMALARCGELQRMAAEAMRERPHALERERQLAESGARLGTARAVAFRERRDQRARALGYDDLKDFYRLRYVDGRALLDELAAELGCAESAVRGDLQRLALGPIRRRSYGARWRARA
jgi:ROS/MUCR transcriptional regulator protein